MLGSQSMKSSFPGSGQGKAIQEGHYVQRHASWGDQGVAKKWKVVLRHVVALVGAAEK